MISILKTLLHDVSCWIRTLADSNTFLYQIMSITDESTQLQTAKKAVTTS